MCREPGRRRPRGVAGFTLTEVMITVTVVALLAVVAYPGYVGAVQKARRAEAKSALTDAAQRLERYYTENNRYLGARFCNSGDSVCTDAVRIFAPASENGRYRLGFADGSPTAVTFTLVAAPQGPQADDPCGSFTLSEAGARGVSGGSQSDPAQCW